MMGKKVIFGLLLFLSFNVKSQVSFEGLRLGISPSSILNIYPAVQFSIDYGLDKNTNINTQWGYIFFSLPNSGFINQSSTGFRWRGGLEQIIIPGKNSAIFIGSYYNITGLFTNYTDWNNKIVNERRIAQSAAFGLGIIRNSSKNNTIKISMATGISRVNVDGLGNSKFGSLSNSAYFHINFNYSFKL